MIPLQKYIAGKTEKYNPLNYFDYFLFITAFWHAQNQNDISYVKFDQAV